MRDKRDRTVAAAFAVLVVVASLPVGTGGVAAAGGGTDAPTVPQTAPGVNASETTWTPGTPANVTAAYNVTNTSDPANTTLWLQNDSGWAVDYRGDLTNDTDAVNLTFGNSSAFDGSTPVEAGGDRRAWVRVYDGDADAWDAETTTVVNVTSPVVVESVTAPSSVAPGEAFTVSATLNNTGTAEERFRLAAYPADGDADQLGTTVATLNGSETKTVSFTAEYGAQYAGETVNFTVNDENATRVTVDATAASAAAEACSWTPCTVAADADALRGEAVTLPVAYNVTGSVDAADANLTVEGPNGLLAYNGSLDSTNGTVDVTLPARAEAGTYRVETTVYNDSTGERVGGTFSLAEVQVVGNTTVTKFDFGTANLTRGETYEATVRLRNTGETAENHTVRVYPSDYRTTPVGNATVRVKPGEHAEATVNVTFPSHYDTGTYNVSAGRFDAGEVTLEPMVELVSLTHVGGSKNTSPLGTSTVAPSSDGGLLQFDLTYQSQQSDRPQNLDGSGLDETSRYEVVLSVPHSYEPSILVATARNVSWDVTNESDGYRVAVTGNPTDAAYMVDGPASVSEWENLAPSEDVATHQYSPMFSLAFVSNDSTRAENVSGMAIATDAQSFTSPYLRRANGSPTLTVDLAAPHETVGGENNTGHYEATLPSDLLASWNVSDPSQLTGEYKNQSVSLNATATADGGVEIGFPTTYSTGTVELAPTAADDGGGTTDDGTTDDGTTDDGSTDGTDADDSTDSTTDDGRSGSTGTTDDADESDADGEGAVRTVNATLSSDGSTASASVEGAAANETVRVRLPENASDAAANATETNESDAAANESAAGDAPDSAARVTELGITLSNDADSVGVNVSAHESVPNGTPELDAGDGDTADGEGASDEAVGYLSIDVSGPSDDDISTATVDFEVSESKLAARNVSPEDVRLYRFHDGTWRELNTTHLGDGRFRAETPGFSVFAVGTTRSSGDAEAETTGRSPGETVTFDAETVTTEAEATSVETDAATTDTEAPGFGAGPAVASLAAAAMALRRRRN